MPSRSVHWRTVVWVAVGHKQRARGFLQQRSVGDLVRQSLGKGDVAEKRVGHVLNSACMGLIGALESRLRRQFVGALPGT